MVIPWADLVVFTHRLGCRWLNVGTISLVLANTQRERDALDGGPSGEEFSHNGFFLARTKVIGYVELTFRALGWSVAGAQR